MTIYLSGTLWLWALRLVALLMTLIVLFDVAVPKLLLGIAWLILLVLSFVTFTGSRPPA